MIEEDYTRIEKAAWDSRWLIGWVITIMPLGISKNIAITVILAAIGTFGGFVGGLALKALGRKGRGRRRTR